MSSRTPIAVDHASPPPPSLVSQLRVAVGMLLGLTLLTGVAYPLLVTTVSRVAFAEAARGSMLTANGKVVGSRHIAQPFEEPWYFWGRPSATAPAANNAQASAGSNLGPTNPDLTKAAQARIDALRQADPGNTAPVPVDLVTSSGSGLDPHITPAGAHYQVARVARRRGLDEAAVQALVTSATEERELGVLGEPRVNVLVLNLALDELGPPKRAP